MSVTRTSPPWLGTRCHFTPFICFGFKNVSTFERFVQHFQDCVATAFPEKEMLTRTMLIVAIVLLGRAEAFTGSLCVPSIPQRMVVLGADADPTTVDSNESLVDKAYAACRVVRGVKSVDKNLDVLCSTLEPQPRYRWQRENLECDIIPGGLRDTSSPRGGLLFACEEARNGRDVEKRAGVKVGALRHKIRHTPTHWELR